MAANFSQAAFSQSCARVEDGVTFVASLGLNASSDLVEVSGEAVILPILLLVASLVMAVRGSVLLRPCCILAAAATGFWLWWDVLHALVGTSRDSLTDSTGGLPCEARVIGAALLALLFGLAAACLIKVGLFLLGALAAGGTAYLIFEAFPALDTGPVLMANRSVLAWVITLAAGLAGGLLVRCKSRPVLEVVTAAVGGAGFAHAVHGIVAIAGGALPGPAAFALAITIGLAGWWLQRRGRLRKGNDKPSHRASLKRNASGPRL